LKKGDAKAAEENYRKSLELNPVNQNAIEVLRRIAEGKR
jgi:Tfp pilus assembly protein PilF